VSWIECRINTKLNLTRVNAGYCKAFGANKLDLMGVNIIDHPLVPQEERSKIVGLLEFCMRHKTTVINSNWTYRKVNGMEQRVLTRWRNEPVRDYRNNIVGVHGYGQIIGGDNGKNKD
jgi:hypothetical protein